MPTTNLYYRVKPYLHWRFRLALRRRLAGYIRRTKQDIWPINHAAGNAPEGWTGWPDGKRFAFVLTHDVEGERGLAHTRPLMRLEMEMGFRSSFNFVPEGEYEVPKALRDDLVANGFEVGVHDLNHDGKLYKTQEEFLAKAKRINRYLHDWNASGFRSGFMLHKLDWLHHLNIKYDASTFDTDPFEPEPDGVGQIFPFWKTDGNGSSYVELPYTLVQDSTLFIYLRETNIDIWKQKLDWLAKRGGMALLIVHPDYTQFGGAKCDQKQFPEKYYRDLLHYVQTKYAGEYWAALPKEVAEWFAVTRPKTDLNRAEQKA